MFLISFVSFLSVSAIFIFFLSVIIIFLVKWKEPRYGGAPRKVSIVIPAYNEQENIAACLKSIFSSNYPEKNIEVLVIDDGSNDKTKEIVKGFKGVRLLEQNHLGKVEALNNGFRSASNEHVITIDADTVLDKNAITELMARFTDSKIGAVTGVAKIKNKNMWLCSFQNIEYMYNCFIREAFSGLFRLSPGICGALTCYRKSIVQKIGGFTKNTAAEDFDVSMHIKKNGYDVVATNKAVGHTIAPHTVKGLFKQRIRWAKGILQGVIKHRDMIGSKKHGKAISLLLSIQLFWYVYSLIVLPIIAYQFAYWLPFNTASVLDVGFYALKWVSLIGPIQVFYMYATGQWAVSYFVFFGVLSGVLSSLLLVFSLRRYGEKMNLRNFLAVFFYFPYTLMLSVMMIASILSYLNNRGEGFFLKK